MNKKTNYTIKIDSTKRKDTEVSLLSDNKIVDSLSGDIDIISSIKSLLERNNLVLNDVTEVVPNVGPGSFTGIKKGVTIANIINWTLGNDKYLNPNYGKEPNINLSK